MENPITCLQDFLPIALAFFDKDTSKERKNQFNEQLQELYKSQSAWKICKDILSHLDQYTTEVKFLAAKILRIKLYYYMIEVPEAEHEPMLMYIVNVMKSVQKENRGFMYELAVSFVIIYMRVFQKCPNLIGFVASHFPADGNKVNQDIIMDILGAVPETMISSSLVVETELRKAFTEFALNKLQPEILENLTAASKGELNDERSYQLLKCFDSWLIEGTSELVKQNLHNSNLLGIAVRELHNIDGGNQEVASDVLQSIMYICKKSLEYIPLYDSLLAGFFSFAPTIKKLVSRGLREDVKPILYVYGKLLSRVFKQILAHPDNKVITFMLYDMFLAVLKNAELELAIDVLGYIEKLIEDLKSVQDPTEVQNRNKFVEFHEEFFKSAVLVSVDICTYTLQQLVYKEDSYYLGDGDADKYMDDDLNSKENHRDSARSMIKELTELVGFTKIFSFVAPRVSESGELMRKRNPQDQQYHSLIAKYEAELKCISSMIHKVDPTVQSDVKYVQGFLEYLLQTDAPDDVLKEAVLKIISKSGNCLQGRPDLLQASFKIVGDFNSKQTFEVLAAECMSSLCSDNPEFVLQNIKDFLNFYTNCTEKSEFVLGLVSLIPKIPSVSDQVVLVQHLLQPFVAQIMEGITKIKAPQDLDKLARKEIKSIISENTDTLGRIVKKLEPVNTGVNEHFFVAILGELWPLMDSVMDYYYDSTEIMESVCRLMKHAMACLKHLFGQFFERYFTTITRNYERYPLATYLYSVENALTTYYSTPDYLPMLSQLYGHMIKKTQAYLSTSDPKKQDPDLIDDFFGLITRFLRKLPNAVVACDAEIAESQFKVAVQCIGITMEGPVKALYQYFDEIFSLYDPEKPIPGKAVFLQIFNEKGYAAAAVTNSIQFLINDCPDRYLCKFFYDVFYAIFKHCRQICIPWFVQALQSVVPANVLTVAEKEKFIHGLQTKDYFSEKEYYNEFLEEFFSRCRTNSSLKH